MKITVKYYARYRDYTGKTEESIEVNFQDLTTLLNSIKITYPRLAKEEIRMVAVNGKLVSDKSTIINEGDVISLFPPVSGG